jgi:hypothetical protein
MDDAVSVRVLERLAQLVCYAHRLTDRQSVSISPLKARVEVTLRHVLADDEQMPIGLTDVVDGHDVGVIAQLRRDSCFVLDDEPRRVAELVGLDEGKGHLAIEPLVVCEIDELPCSLADEPVDPVAPG